MNLGLTKFQNDYILAVETFSRSYVPSLLDEPNLVLHLLSDLSFRAYFEFKQIWQLLCLFRVLHLFMLSCQGVLLKICF